MKGDFSRLNFPWGRNYTQVLKQQGRVDLDADWNEQAAIQERRRRTALRDIVGRDGAPSRDAAFGAELSDDRTDVFFSAGRIYADGLLLELSETTVPVKFVNKSTIELASLVLDGRELQEGDWVELLTGRDRMQTRIERLDPESNRATLRDRVPLLGAVRLRRRVTYLTQPGSPVDQLQPSSSSPDQTDLLFLDVWEGHVTAIEDPDIREVALGGPDTTTRMKTFWQVRVLRNASAGCATDLEALLGRSGGRLSTEVLTAPSPTDPCEIPPIGGYSGLENRLYRVEIHTGGRLGEATWKWSRDNGSVLLAVEEFLDARTVCVRRLGRDQVLTVRQGDWIEITDDQDDWLQQPGFVARVALDVDEGRRLITLDRELPLGRYSLSGHPRVRRWDHVADPGGPGVLMTGAGPADLEDGIGVHFSGTDFRAGDYWTFTARTAIRAIDERREAPPEGVRHRYLPLAQIRWQTSPNGLTAQVTDCRKLFVPLTERTEGCGCTICVTPEGHKSGDGTLQAAVDAVRERGGIICLAPGQYVLQSPLVISGAQSVRVVGAGPSSKLVAHGNAIEVTDAIHLVLQDFAIRQDEPGTPAIQISNSSEVLVEQLTVLSPTGIGLGGVLNDVAIRDCVVRAHTGIDVVPTPISPADGPKNPREAVTSLYRLRVEGNRFDCRDIGLNLAHDMRFANHDLLLHLDTRIAGNFITGCSSAGIVLAGVGGWPTFDPPPDLMTSPTPEDSGEGVDIVGNDIRVLKDGIRAGATLLRLTSNDITASPGWQSSQGVAFSLISPVRSEIVSTLAFVYDVSVADNRIGGFGLGVQFQHSADWAKIAHNRIEVRSQALTCTPKIAWIRALVVTGNSIFALEEPVSILGSTIIFASNYVRALKDRAVHLRTFEPAIRAPLTVLGNITRGTISVNDGPLFDPWDKLNVRSERA